VIPSSSYNPTPSSYQAPTYSNRPLPPPNGKGLQGNVYGDVTADARNSFSFYSPNYVPPTPMTYMNSVPANTSNFIPITADFSKFV